MHLTVFYLYRRKGSLLPCAQMVILVGRHLKLPAREDNNSVDEEACRSLLVRWSSLDQDVLIEQEPQRPSRHGGIAVVSAVGADVGPIQDCPKIHVLLELLHPALAAGRLAVSTHSYNPCSPSLHLEPSRDQLLLLPLRQSPCSLHSPSHTQSLPSPSCIHHVGRSA